MTKPILRVGQEMDSIGWRNLTEGMVSTELKRLQSCYLHACNSTITADTWTKGFIGKLLEISHGQWICRNLTKHHRTKGASVLQTKTDIMRETERQLNLGLESLPPEASCLLEIDPLALRSSNHFRQQYWLAAVTAARKAGKEASRLSKGKTTSWDEIRKNAEFAKLYGYEGLLCPPGLVMNVVFSQTVEDVSENARANLGYEMP